MTKIIQQANAVNSNTVTLSGTPANGNTLIVGIRDTAFPISGAPINGQTKMSAGWTVLTGGLSTNGGWFAYHNVGPGESANQVPTSIAGAYNGFSMTMWELANVKQPVSSAVDVELDVSGGSTTGVKTITASSPGFHTYGTNDLVLGVAGFKPASAGTISITNAGWTAETTTNGTQEHIGASQTIASAGVAITLAAYSTVGTVAPGSPAASSYGATMIALYTLPDPVGSSQGIILG